MSPIPYAYHLWPINCCSAIVLLHHPLVIQHHLTMARLSKGNYTHKPEFDPPLFGTCQPAMKPYPNFGTLVHWGNASTSSLTQGICFYTDTKCKNDAKVCMLPRSALLPLLPSLRARLSSRAAGVGKGETAFSLMLSDSSSLVLAERCLLYFF